MLIFEGDVLIGYKRETKKKLNCRNPGIKKYGLKMDKYKTVTRNFKEACHQNNC
jgi:hypothetical protein